MNGESIPITWKVLHVVLSGHSSVDVQSWYDIPGVYGQLAAHLPAPPIAEKERQHTLPLLQSPTSTHSSGGAIWAMHSAADAPQNEFSKAKQHTSAHVSEPHGIILSTPPPVLLEAGPVAVDVEEASTLDAATSEVAPPPELVLAAFASPPDPPALAVEALVELDVAVSLDSLLPHAQTLDIASAAKTQPIREAMMSKVSEVLGVVRVPDSTILPKR